MSQIDWAFIKGKEGFLLKGYVPKNKDGTVMGKSGVTIGAGYDIGNHSVAEVMALGLSDFLLSKLVPYAGLTKDAAVAALAKQPLTLTKAEGDQLTVAVETQYAKAFATVYNKFSRVPFDQIHPAAQTVLMSVAYQYGNDLPHKTPNFWKLVTVQNWKGAIAALNNFGDAYGPRRQSEAKYLQEHLT